MLKQRKMFRDAWVEILLGIDFLGKSYSVRDISRKVNLSDPTVVKAVSFLHSLGILDKHNRGVSITNFGIITRSELLRIQRMLLGLEPAPDNFQIKNKVTNHKKQKKYRKQKINEDDCSCDARFDIGWHDQSCIINDKYVLNIP